MLGENLVPPSAKYPWALFDGLGLSREGRSVSLKHSLGAFPCNTTCNSRPCMTSWRPSDNCMVVAAPATQFGPHPIVLASSSFSLFHYDTSVRDCSLSALQHLKFSPFGQLSQSVPLLRQTFVFSYLVHFISEEKSPISTSSLFRTPGSRKFIS